jgi:hypothetical protein
MTSTNGTTINIESIGSIDGLAHSKGIDLLGECIYFYPQFNILLNLIEASFLRDTGRSIPTTRKIPQL